jgi:hypothetical protein
MSGALCDPLVAMSLLSLLICKKDPRPPTFKKPSRPRACCLILSWRERRWERELSHGTNARVAAPSRGPRDLEH